MKKILIVGYILGTLLISGFARAEGTRVPIQNIVYADGSWNIGVSGTLNSPCLASPVAHLDTSIKKNVFVMSMVSEQRSEICMAVIGGTYSSKIDLRRLVIDSGIKIEADKEYTIRADGYDFEVSFTGQDLLIALPYNPIEML